MALERRLVSILVAAAGALLLTCSRPGPILSVTFDPLNDESGWYPVDVANWHAVRTSSGHFEYYYTLTDAVAGLQAMVLDPGTGRPCGSRAIRLESYEVNWISTGIRLPKMQGVLNVMVPPDTRDPAPAKFPVLVLSAITKDTARALVVLRGDPEESFPNTFNGQQITTAEIVFEGHDLTTDDEVTASLRFTAGFADYIDPNTYH